jgi:hypothetical protein
MIRRAEPSLRVVSTHLREVNAYVLEHNRHHGPVVGHKLVVAVATEDDVTRRARQQPEGGGVDLSRRGRRRIVVGAEPPEG